MNNKDNHLIFEAYKNLGNSSNENEDLISQYTELGYQPYYDPTQASVIDNTTPCNKCKGTNTEYVGLKFQGPQGRKIVSIQKCNDCGYQEEY